MRKHRHRTKIAPHHLQTNAEPRPAVQARQSSLLPCNLLPRIELTESRVTLVHPQHHFISCPGELHGLQPVRCFYFGIRITAEKSVESRTRSEEHTSQLQ